MAKRQYTLSTVCMYRPTLLYNYIIMHYTVTIEGKAENAFTPDNMLFHRFMKVMSITALRDTLLRITTIHPCRDCGNLINSMYYKEYLQSDQDSTSVLQQVSKIVSSSTDFRQLAGCAQFSAKWAFVVTWIEAEDYRASQSGSGSGDTSFTGFSMVSIYDCILQ